MLRLGVGRLVLVRNAAQGGRRRRRRRRGGGGVVMHAHAVPYTVKHIDIFSV